MTLPGRPFLVALLLWQAGAASGDVLRISTTDHLLLERHVTDAEWCLHWSHSVTGGPVADCFAAQDGRLFLTRSFLHDFAAGLGHIPGRGIQRAAEGGGYWIDAINEPIPDNRLLLRIGAARVGHEIRIGTEVINLSDLAAGQRAELRLLPQEHD